MIQYVCIRARYMVKAKRGGLGLTARQGRGCATGRDIKARSCKAMKPFMESAKS